MVQCALDNAAVRVSKPEGNCPVEVVALEVCRGQCCFPSSSQRLVAYKYYALRKGGGPCVKTFASVTVFFCDYLQTLEAEVYKIWKPVHSRGCGLGQVLFLVCRYTAFLDLPVNTICTFLTGTLSQEASHQARPAQGPPIGVYGNCCGGGDTLVLSLYALLGAERKHTIILSIICIPVTLGALSILIASFIVDVCYYILLAGEFAIAAVALLLGVRDHFRFKGPLLSILRRDGTIYYLALMCLNVLTPYMFPEGVLERRMVCPGIASKRTSRGCVEQRRKDWKTLAFQWRRNERKSHENEGDSPTYRL
ncbi:hypothetical protein CC1G_14889 [Coprinopsis cinerea okayama7|uniref:DUF6533 domain-containing protein n=1 Tax=Coprinopsis cinerea (strain Okayama-7 / 130 / ATCC MYA-4618 / FGSC 9003) TaxID=240176 RepID=D6RNK2_COPC7|nr:hypothetical protein CC1G_14889 [Coprinopsis cinerea okayama7\|eukprot:XP_002910912.1 hypothetical protein CC1G_14889 [Coprinopsis cinerea okayama7\